MKMVMNRDLTVSGLSGHAIRFKKGVPTNVPPQLMEDVMMKGGIPAEGESMPEYAEEKPVAVPMGLARKDAIFNIFKDMIDENNRNDFNASGLPKVGAVKKRAGFDVDTQELKSLWTEYGNR